MTPANLTLAAVGATTIGTVLQAYGAKQQAQATAAMHRYNAEVGKREAEYIRRKSREEQRLMRDRARQTLKTQRVQYAKGKVRPVLAVLTESAEIMAEDIAMFAGERKIEAQRALSGASFDLLRATLTERAGRLTVGGTLFGGLSRVATMGLEYQLRKKGKI